MNIGYTKASEALEGLFENKHRKDWGGVSTGFLEFDKIFTIRRGELTVVTGVPSHGKSQFLDQLVWNLYARHGHRTAFVSLEAIPVQDHWETLLEIHLKKPFRRRKEVEGMTEQEIRDGMASLEDYFFMWNPDERWLTLKTILSETIQLHNEKPIHNLIIDPWNCIDHTREGKEARLSETEYISNCLSRMKTFAAAESIHVFLVAHPTKLRPEIQGEAVPVPGPYDISGSAHFYNKPDNCITVYRTQGDGESDPVAVHIKKVKRKSVGKQGSMRFDYDHITGRYKEVGKARAVGQPEES